MDRAAEQTTEAQNMENIGHCGQHSSTSYIAVRIKYATAPHQEFNRTLYVYCYWKYLTHHYGVWSVMHKKDNRLDI